MSSFKKFWYQLTFAPRLRAGDWVEVRSAAEILATLDDRQCLDGLPFMPEMLQYCGKRFRVYKSAHKTCDTVERWFVMRRMTGAVHLEGLRCDGGAHDGCQAGYLLFFKEAWLKPVESGTASVSASSAPSRVRLEALHRATRTEMNGTGVSEQYRCQATDLVRA